MTRGGKAKGAKPKNPGRGKANQSTANETSNNQAAINAATNQTLNEEPSMDVSHLNQNSIEESNMVQDNSESNTCVLCGLHTGDYIVQCDDCGKWYHFQCVQLEDIGEDDPWSCYECLSKQTEHGESNQPTIHQPIGEADENDLNDLSESNRHESVNGNVSSSQRALNPVKDIQYSSQSNDESKTDPKQQNLSIASIRMHNDRLSNSFNPMGTAKTSTVISDEHQDSRIIKPVDGQRSSITLTEINTRLQSLLSVNRIAPLSAKSLQSLNEGPPTKIQSVTSLPEYATGQFISSKGDHDVSKNQQTSKSDDKVKTAKSQRSSKTTSSKQNRINLEEIRLQEELKLQEKLDEARIGIEMKALELKEAREQRFLNEKLKLMEEELSDNASNVTGGTAKTKKTKRSHCSDLSRKTDLVSEWVNSQRRQISKTTPVDVRVRRFDSKIDQFDFNYSIPVEDHELRNLKKKYSKAWETNAKGLENEPEKLKLEAQSFNPKQPTVDLKNDNEQPKEKLGVQNQQKVILNNKPAQNQAIRHEVYVQQHPSQRTRSQQPMHQQSTNNGVRIAQSADLIYEPDPTIQHGQQVSKMHQQNQQSKGIPNRQVYQQVPSMYGQSPQNIPRSYQLYEENQPINQESQQSTQNHQFQQRSHQSYQQQKVENIPLNQRQEFSSNQVNTGSHQSYQQQNVGNIPLNQRQEFSSEQTTSGNQKAYQQSQENANQQSNYFHQSIPTSQNHGFSQSHQSQSNQRKVGNIPLNENHQFSPNQANVGIKMGNQSSSGANQVECQQLTANQIASRHVVTKKLPYFYGNPARWPEFIQKYRNTTAKCGFDDAENMDRLSECLRGTAYTIVKSQLLMPHCLKSVLDTLEQRYGRPEIVCKAILTELREIPPIKADKLEALSNFGYEVQNACETIQGQDMHFYLYNPELVQELVEKLPHQTKIEWAKYSINLSQVTMITLSEWLVALSRSLNRIIIPEVSLSSKEDRKSDRKSEGSKSDRKSENSKPDNTTENWLNAHGVSKAQKYGEKSKCLSCSKNCKNLSECPKFKGLSVEARWKFMYDNNKICRGCLRNHGRKCTELKECGVKGCTFKHHPILHNDKKHPKDKPAVQTPVKEVKQESDTSKPDGTCNAHGGGQPVLYKILPIKLKFGDKTLRTFAYMDDGSGLTLLENDLAEELGLKGIPESLCLRWTSGTIRHEKESMRVDLEVSSVEKDQHNYPMKNVRTVKLLDLPKQEINREQLINKYPYLERIPFQEFEAKPRILIGLDNIKLGLSREHVEGGWQEPVISKTLLGWVVHGPNGPTSGADNSHMQHHVLSISCNECPCQPDRDEQLHKQIEEFFSLENFGTRALTNSVESKEIQRAKRIMEQTTVRKNGRFETGLLWKFDDIVLPNNLHMAMKRLECQERKLQANKMLMENMNGQIEAFITKGYIRKLTPQEAQNNNQRTTYLPLFHHLDPKKPEKVRMVWDAAAKYKGVSLNSMLLTGPDDFVALPDVLRRFREKRIAIGGDIEEMYHQVGVRKEDQNSQRFLWRNGNTKAVPDVYVMQVLTFGSTCSPSLAQFVKNKNASEFESEYPKAAKAIKENHYVDDWLDCQDTIEDTVQLAKDVRFVHQQGGFKLRKFISNSPEVLKALGEVKEQHSKDLNVSKASSTQRVLGMWWDTQTDCFMYSLKFTKLNEEVLLGLRAPTKREILQTLMSIFDPLGLIAFFLVYLKMLLQDIWKARLNWDEKLPNELNEKWNKWIKLLPSIEGIRIPRQYSQKLSPGPPKSIELHTFVDASENGYCATCFLRTSDADGIECTLVEAKTKVAPIKPLLTIPRLELLAAVLGTRLASSVGKSLSIPINKRIFWSDSRDVLCWIRSINRKYRQFVAFRVGEILETSKEEEWRFVPGKLNVADDGTKWAKQPNFSPNSRWYKGPEFLYQSEHLWPKDLSKEETTNEEIHVHFPIIKSDPPTNIVPERFSRWSHMVNAQALSTRYVKKLMAKVRKETITGPLKHQELKAAEYTLYKLAQFDCFSEEITTLQKQKQKFGDKSYVKKSSSLYRCSPYLDEDGLLRVRGRIDKVKHVKFDTRRPIILPKYHVITKLIVNNYHRMFLHQNNNTVINELRQKYYIPRLRVVLRKVVAECQTCKNKRAKPQVPEMGDLPIARLSPTFRVFTHTGVDFFGPMFVTVNRGVQKRWGVLFTCLTVRAIHIEIAASLDTDSCILCIRNFINIRGTPAEFYSDNGTNMKAADKVLREEFEKIDKDKIQSTFTKSYSKWNFNPPASPHMAGAWEVLIKLVKKNLKVLLPTRTPREELLRSYLLEVMNIVNSRPLTYLEIESNEDEALTPNHFLLGSSNGIMAPGEFPYEEKTLTKSWRRSQELTNMFWRRWIKEYLPTLTRRSKWFPKVKPIEVGDVVLLVDEKNARNSYPKATVLEVMPDKRGQVRQALVRTTEVIPGKAGETKDAAVKITTKVRPVAKLAVLDVANKEVKTIETAVTKGLTKGENVTDSNSNDVIDSNSNHTNRDKADKNNDDSRKLLFSIRRSKRIAAKSKQIA